MSPRPGWAAIAARTIGSVHVRDERPLQDAVAHWSDERGAVLAVADGHGHRLHFRSDTGADLAVRTAVAVVREHLHLLDDVTAARDALAAVGAEVVDAWRAAVAEHVAEHPLVAPGATVPRDQLQPYGTTLLVAAAGPAVAAFWQVGDGDTVVVHRTGEVARPLPDDPDLDGVRTSSLCQPDPLASLRTTAVDLADHDLALAYLCTDGFGGPRVDPAWWVETGEDLLRLTREHGRTWVAEQLPGWLEEPALVGGDDVSLGVLLRADLGDPS